VVCDVQCTVQNHSTGYEGAHATKGLISRSWVRTRLSDILVCMAANPF
jgi:phage protein D